MLGVGDGLVYGERGWVGMPKLCAGGDLPSVHQPFGKAMVCVWGVRGAWHKPNIDRQLVNTAYVLKGGGGRRTTVCVDWERVERCRLCAGLACMHACMHRRGLCPGRVRVQVRHRWREGGHEAPEVAVGPHLCPPQPTQLLLVQRGDR